MNIALALIRHGPTQWNEEKRIQGSSDIKLNEAGRERVRQWKLPMELEGFAWVASPLMRARETAEILLGNWGDTLNTRSFSADDRLREMHWGDWEGEKLDNLRSELGAPMTENEAQGLDFRPPGGESPRELQERLGLWLAEVSEGGIPTLAIAHHGVIRALYALATGWDMTGKRPVKFHRAAVHFFSLEDGNLSVEKMNVMLEE